MLRPILRSLIPRVTAPLLPVSRIRQPLTSGPRSSNPRLFSHFPARLSSSPPPKDTSPDQSLSQRLKHLIKSYGWYALGVYIVFSVLDFAAAFAAINLIGAEQVSHMAASVKGTVSGIIHSKPPEPGRDELDPATSSQVQHGNEGLYAMLVLAWTIHKTIFLPVRVGLTAALTPRLVGWLRVRGWAGGEGTRRAAEEMRERLRNARKERSSR
ncbi:peptide alpha-n-acetyltransferase [Moniliophthora roreri MCA 2997]|uniref:Peptide alpha-n-acetyltransferase n=2 Tax=Moniliophthora roreri TaxID=221103 RepID=V2X1C5_MONRO|nr:peptide alpha-n-acetyltransferase [Moniliophthora roreri MCA 2997]